MLDGKRYLRNPMKSRCARPADDDVAKQRAEISRDEYVVRSCCYGEGLQEWLVILDATLLFGDKPIYYIHTEDS